MALEINANAAKAAEARKLVRRDIRELAPKMQTAVLNAINECASAGYPVQIYECLRTHQLAKMYYELKVSKAKDGFKTWHFYGLGVDIIHPVHAWKWWDSPHEEAVEWRENVVEIFKSHGLDWGGDFKSFPDRPHFQWGLCKPSPSSEAVRLVEAGGREAVWKAVGAY